MNESKKEKEEKRKKRVATGKLRPVFIVARGVGERDIIAVCLRTKSLSLAFRSGCLAGLLGCLSVCIFAFVRSDSRLNGALIN